MATHLQINETDDAEDSQDISENNSDIFDSPNTYYEKLKSQNKLKRTDSSFPQE